MRLVMVGPPGAGKGTQASRLCQHYHVPHISTGAMLREQIACSTELGLKAKAYVESGELVPDDVIVVMLKETLAAQPDGFILDGFPRTLKQAQVLDLMLLELHQELSAVVYLSVPDEVVVERLLQRGRADDTEEIIGRRLEVFNEETTPVLEHYAKSGLLVEVEGVGSIEQVQDRMRVSLGKRSKE